MAVLVFSENDGIAFELLAKAREVFPGGPAGALLLGDGPERAENFIAHGADTVHHASKVPADAAPDACAHALRSVAEAGGYDTVLTGSTRRGKVTASLLAQALDCGCVTDAIDMRVEGGALQTDRYALAGNTVATETIKSPRRVVSVMPHAFRAAKADGKGAVKEFAAPAAAARTKVVERRPKVAESVNIEEAKVIVGVGKGFAKREDLALARDLASVLGGELGCTRPVAVDFKWLPEERCIGLSYRKLTPDLYIAVGVSGQVQHTVGVTRARTIVAINRAEDAPIFAVSDYCVVGDLYAVLPRLTEALKRARGR